jgi:hypothetical protein
LRQHFLATRDARVADQCVEIFPKRLGELRLRIQKIHDAQVGREIARERDKILLRHAALCGIRPHAGDAVRKVGRRGADRFDRHLWMAGCASLAAPLARAAGQRGGLRLRRRRVLEQAIENLRVRRNRSGEIQRRRNNRHRPPNKFEHGRNLDFRCFACGSHASKRVP